MARFYIHLHQAGHVLSDLEGVEMPDLAALRRHAVTIARDLVAGDAVRGVVDLDAMLRVVDGTDTQVLDVRFSDAVSFVSGRRA